MGTHKKDNTDKLIKQAIVLAIDSIREDICSTSNDEENLKRSKAILNLVQAFAIISEHDKEGVK